MGKLIDFEEWRQFGSTVPACVAGVMLSAVHSYTLGVMMPSLEQEFGWTRAEISIGPMIPSIAAVLLAPIVGNAMDRLGPRRIALFGVPLFCAALAMLSTATANILSWWLLYGLLGFATMFIFSMVWTAPINSRFRRNRGLALAIALAGTGISSAVMPVTASWLLQWLGWRGAYVGIALISCLLVFPLVYFLFDRDTGLSPPPPILAIAARKTSIRLALGSRSFLKLAGAATIFSAGACVLTLNSVPILIGEGLAPFSAAKIAGLIGIGTIAGRIGGGFLLDRIDARFVALACAIAPLAGASVLLATDNSQTAAMIACLAIGVAGGAEFDACSYLSARHFGMDNYGSLFGLIAGLSLLGAGLAPVLANYVYDQTGSYDPVLWAIMPAFGIAGLLFLALGPCEEAPEFANEPLTGAAIPR